MPFKRPHVMLTFFGKAWTEKETWQFGLRLDQPEPPLDAAMVLIRDAYKTYHAALGTGISYGCRYFGVKVAKIGTDGKYVPGSSAKEYLLAASERGGNSASFMGLPQAALAITLNTSLIRGKGSVGRYFLPAMALSVMEDGLISTTAAEAARATSITFLNAVNAQAPGRLAVFGQTGEGTVQPVTGIRVGRKVDTQRRRARSIKEAYVVGVITPP